MQCLILADDASITSAVHVQKEDEKYPKTEAIEAGLRHIDEGGLRGLKPPPRLSFLVAAR